MAEEANELNADAAVISSYDKNLKMVDSRCVNIKYLIKDKFIFFSNYNSTKALQFKDHQQISALFFWKNINTQIRIKAIIAKIPQDESDQHFKKRTKEKNALAVSSHQSQIIENPGQVISNYEEVLRKIDYIERPHYWGGYSFKPYEIEFWKGNKNRLNEREMYVFNKEWNMHYLQP